MPASTESDGHSQSVFVRFAYLDVTTLCYGDFNPLSSELRVKLGITRQARTLCRAEQARIRLRNAIKWVKARVTKGDRVRKLQQGRLTEIWNWGMRFYSCEAGDRLTFSTRSVC